MDKLRLGALLASMLVASSVQAAPGQFYIEMSNEDKGIFTSPSEGLYGEDDSDGGLTESFYLSYSSPLSDRDYMTFFIDHGAYTPGHANKRMPTVQEGDRPFSSYFGVGGNYRFRWNDYVQEVGGRVVGTGKYGLGEAVLNSAHSASGNDEYNGWEDEVEDKVGGILEYRISSKHFGYCASGLCFEANPHASLMLGNMVNQAGAGGTLRIGNNVTEDYGPSNFSLFSRGQNYIPFRGVTWEAFFGAEARYVADNYFLEGDTKITGESIVDMENSQLDVHTGVTFNFAGQGFNALANITLTSRSPEFVGQTTQQFVRLGIGFQY